MRSLLFSALLLLATTSVGTAQGPQAEMLRMPPPPPPPPPEPEPRPPEPGPALIGAMELGLAMRAQTDSERFGLVLGGRTGLAWIGETLVAGLILDARYEHGPARVRATMGSLIGNEVAQLSGGYVLELRDEMLVHGASAEVALTTWQRHQGLVETFWRLTRLFPDQGEFEQLFTMGIRVKARAASQRRRERLQNLARAPTVGMFFLTRVGADRPEGWLARLQATSPLLGLAAGLGFQRMNLQGEDGRGAYLDLAGRFSFVGLLARAWPDLLRWIDLNAEVGAEIGGLNDHGFRGALWAGGTIDLRFSIRDWFVHPSLQFGYRYHVLRWPTDAPDHQILFGIGLAGIGRP